MVGLKSFFGGGDSGWHNAIDSAIGVFLKAMYFSYPEAEEDAQRVFANQQAMQALNIAKRSNDRISAYKTLLVLMSINTNCNEGDPFSMMTKAEFREYESTGVDIGSYHFGPSMDLYNISKNGKEIFSMSIVMTLMSYTNEERMAIYNKRFASILEK